MSSAGVPVCWFPGDLPAEGRAAVPCREPQGTGECQCCPTLPQLEASAESCLSPGKQLSLLTSRLCFSQEEEMAIERQPRGSLPRHPARPSRAREQGLQRAGLGPQRKGREPMARPGLQQAQGVWQRAGPCLGHPESHGNRGQWQGCSHRTSHTVPQAQALLLSLAGAHLHKGVCRARQYRQAAWRSWPPMR